MLALHLVLAAAAPFFVDASVGNSTFRADFDAQFGERITALSSEVGCSFSYDEGSLAVAGTCTVPLKSIHVDGDDVKASHFQQWATNNKSDPKACRIEATLSNVRLTSTLVAGTPTSFRGEALFKVCGRLRADRKPEQVEGSVMVFPASTYNKEKTLKIHARVEKFSRDQYRISPRYTEGWQARVQQLAPIVADLGSIDLVLFAKAGTAARQAR